MPGRSYLPIIVLCLFLPLLSQAQQAEGVHFFKGSWSELLATAEKEHKPIFVDVYTDWCPPCKRMEKEVFPLHTVGVSYNEHFICYQLNAEKNEGVDLAKKYTVKAYPTYLFLDSKGNILARKEDYLPEGQFINLGLQAAKLNGQAGSLAQLQEQFSRGDHSPAFLRTYLEKRTSLKQDNAEVLNAYIALLPKDSLTTPKEIVFLSHNIGTTPSNAIPVVLDALPALTVTQQKEVVTQLYNQVLYTAFGLSIRNHEQKEATQLLSYINRIRPYIAEKLLLSMDNLELHYSVAFHDTARLKTVGYRMAAQQMLIDTATIHKQDTLLFNKAMEPILTGKQDSTKIPNFQAEKKLAAIQSSAQVATMLYTIAEAFRTTLNPGDPALKDAATWAVHALELYPNDAIRKLTEQLLP